MNLQTLTLPDNIVVDFDQLWNLHPAERHWIKIGTKDIQVPRYQQAYGKSYSYSGNINHALPITEELNEFLNYGIQNIDNRLNGILINWYDASENHYIGPHSDSTTDLIPGTPIVTISLGDSRLFKISGSINEIIETMDRMVIVMPWDINKSCKHEILKTSTKQSKRISITLRAFKE